MHLLYVISRRHGHNLTSSTTYATRSAVTRCCCVRATANHTIGRVTGVLLLLLLLLLSVVSHDGIIMLVVMLVSSSVDSDATRMVIVMMVLLHLVNVMSCRRWMVAHVMVA